MSFDLSRIRFDARNDFLGVVMQQGRVQLDADWNEWVAQLARRIQAGTLDTFSGNVVPRITPDGFLVEASGGGLTIGAGRIYVDGLLAENHGGDPDAWDPRLAELSGTTPLNYADQPYLPNPPDLPDGGPHLVYVDVWQRDITPQHKPDLIEQAVGVDSTGRLQTVWQVKVLETEGNISCATPDEDIPGWLEATAPSAARLSTATGDPTFEPDPCKIPPAAGYRGLENQLYRVEVHTGGALGDATFKWSRDNASVASRATHINPARDRVTVESIGRDDVLRFHDGDWVEVTDDWLELHGLPGELRRIRVAGGVDETARTLEFDSPLSNGLFPTDPQQAVNPERNTRVRCWDQGGQVRKEDGTAVEDLNDPTSTGAIEIRPAGTRLFLENGILVDFSLEPSDGDFKTGDYWVFAARSVDASIEILDHAPPLGIHHHYARLAVVTFPDSETDCRTLWPPLQEGGSDGQSCDCTVCVSAEGHNSGTATIQQAVDSIKDTGGTICLGIGSYSIADTIKVDSARSLRIRGQGLGTILVGSKPGGVLSISGSTGVALENFTAVGSAGSSGTTAIVDVNTAIDFRVEHVNILGLDLNDSTAIGIGLSGNMLGVSVSDSAIVASVGIAGLGNEKKHLLTGELRLRRNLFFCKLRAISFDGTSLHAGSSQVMDNLMLVGRQVAVVATGAVLPGSPFTVSDNVIYTSGNGIRAGVSGLAVERNEITGLGAADERTNGIEVVEGLLPAAIDSVLIVANRLTALSGSGITITHKINSAVISNNKIDGMGESALVMSEGGAIGNLSLAGNHFHNLGESIEETKTAFAAIQLIRVERGDVLDNVISNVARQIISRFGIDGLRGLAIGNLRIAGNRFYGIGPDSANALVAAANLPPPFGRVAFDDNFVDRLGDARQQPAVIDWRALMIGRVAGAASPGFMAANFIRLEEAAFMMTANRVAAVPVRRPDLSVRGNQMHGILTRVPIIFCESVDNCLLSENHCEVTGEGRSDDAPLIGDLRGRTLNASNNRLVGMEKLDTLHLSPGIERAIVIGNTSTGNIRILNGDTVPSDINLTNIIGT